MRFLAIIISICIASPLLSQEDTNKVAFVGYWNVGDSYSFKVSKIDKSWEDGNLKDERETSYIARFVVIDSTEKSYTIQWSYENTILNRFSFVEDVNHILEKYKDISIVYKTDELGVLQSIVNGKEVSNQMVAMLDEVESFLNSSDNANHRITKTVIPPLKEVYGSQSGIEQLVMKELQYFHYPMGVEFDITETYSYPDKVPSAFGGRPIAATGTIEFNTISREDNFCTFTYKLALDPDDTKEMIKQVFKKMGISGKDAKKLLEKSIIEINDTNEYAYYYYPGIPHKIEALRETQFNLLGNNGKRVDKLVIELIYDDAAQ